VSDDVISFATPLEIVIVPRTVEPSLKVIVPLGEPAPGASAATDAVNVTD